MIGKDVYSKLSKAEKLRCALALIEEDDGITGGDKTLKLMLSCYSNHCFEDNNLLCIRAAIRGCKRESMADVYAFHHPTEKGQEPDLTPPFLSEQVNGIQKWNPPGVDFKNMGTMALQVLEIFMTACNHHGCAPLRWNWEYALFKEMGVLNSLTDGLRKRAMLVCLRLSAAATDKSCIQGTGKLFKAGYLDMEELSLADHDTIADLIKEGGIQHVKADDLIGMAKIMVEHYNSECPTTLADLLKLPGVDRKTSTIFLSEACGIPEGIGTDSHVVNLVKAFVFAAMKKGDPELRPLLAEEALRQWVPQRDFKKVNMLLGSLAQMFTQTFESVRTSDQKIAMQAFVRAMSDYLHKDYHVELLWFMIRKCRDYYAKMKKEKELMVQMRVDREQ